MQQAFIEYIYLILIILGLVMLGNKLKVSYPIVLVLGGLVLSFTTTFSHITIDPELIFFIFLPPLLYEAAWQTSWKEFWKWRRVIMSFAFPIVILTSCVVAVVSNALIPGFTLALGFLLGGIVSPPDAISATSIMRHVKVPRSMVSIAEGESLLNDASSLIVFRFAIIAVMTGQFVFQEALGNFFLVIVMGAIIGLAVALIFYAIHRWLPTAPSMDIVLSFVTPYTMYYFAERFHFSGVIAVVSGGLLLSGQREKMLTHLSRIQGSNVWSTVGFVLNGLVFLLIGLQLPAIVDQLENIGLSAAINYGLIIAGVLIVTRLLCTMGASVFTTFMSRFITVADAHPGFKAPFVLGWAGMRGVVSLAMALSIPVFITGTQQPFPQRNLILFITFLVILITLVFQGLTLPWIIRLMNLEDRNMPARQQETIIMKKMARASISFLEERYADKVKANEHLKIMKSRLNKELEFFSMEGVESLSREKNPMIEHQLIALEMLEEQRRMLHLMNQKDEFDEEIIRKYLALLDLEETRLREKLPAGYNV
jgi:CPA1 family monovalent cation:H+ antiporter